MLSALNSAKDTVAKFRDDANQQSKAKLNMEDVKLPSRKIAMCGIFLDLYYLF